MDKSKAMKLMAESHRQTVRELERENKVYRKVLEFYANKENYRKLIINGNTMHLGRMIIEEDNGKKARVALEGESDE